jgi:hypothetical protein
MSRYRCDPTTSRSTEAAYVDLRLRVRRIMGVDRHRYRLERRDAGAVLPAERLRDGNCSPALRRAVVRCAHRRQIRRMRHVPDRRHGNRARCVLQHRARVLAHEQTLIVVSAGRPDHQQVSLMAPNEFVQSSGHGAGLHADQPRISRLVLHRRQPFECAPAVRRPGASARVGSGLRHDDLHVGARRRPVARHQLQRECERVAARFQVGDADDHVPEHLAAKDPRRVSEPSSCVLCDCSWTSYRDHAERVMTTHPPGLRLLRCGG